MQNSIMQNSISRAEQCLVGRAAAGTTVRVPNHITFALLTMLETRLCRRIPAQAGFFSSRPANVTGIRAGQILSDCAQSELPELQRRLRREGVTLGELFCFISGLYFRGKLAYARTFARVPRNFPGTYIITACGGLIPPETRVTLKQVRDICCGDVDPASARYRVPLDRDLQSLSEVATDWQIVLLGCIATPKYIDPLLEILGERLFFPVAFVGRGDMSRGGLLLRCVDAGPQLTYAPATTAVRHGRRPPTRTRRLSTAEKRHTDNSR